MNGSTSQHRGCFPSMGQLWQSLAPAQELEGSSQKGILSILCALLLFPARPYGFGIFHLKALPALLTCTCTTIHSHYLFLHVPYAQQTLHMHTHTHTRTHRCTYALETKVLPLQTLPLGCPPTLFAGLCKDSELTFSSGNCPQRTGAAVGAQGQQHWLF